MPELPDVEVFRGDLDATSLHQKIRSVGVRNEKILGDGSAHTLQSTLKGKPLGSPVAMARTSSHDSTVAGGCSCTSEVWRTSRVQRRPFTAVCSSPSRTATISLRLSENVRQGESPRRGRPFVGNVGKLLDELLEEAEIDRSKLYVTNVVKIRPTKESGGSTQNRPPRAGEIRESIDVLKEELDPVKPRALALLGSTPAKTMMRKLFTLRSEHGTLFDIEFGMPALATYHPAYLLRLRGVGSED